MADRTDQRDRVVFRGMLLGVLALLVVGLLHSQSTSAQEATGSGGSQVYFEETGQVLSGPFLEAWTRQGGADRHGLPVTPPTKVGDLWMQWFEYSRLDIAGVSLEQASADDVRVVPIGRIYASKLSYQSTHAAFQRHSAGDGAEFFEETGHNVANGFLSVYKSDGNDQWLGLPISEEFSMNGETYQFFEYGALSWTADGTTSRVTVGTLDAVLSGQYRGAREKPETAITYGPGFLADVYGTDQLMWNQSLASKRWIDVNLTSHTLTAYVDDVPVLSTLVVTGADVSPTATGDFNVRWKLRSQDMEGTAWNGEHYYAEDVPSVMYFYQDFAIHGAYWRNGFGYSASHGCVNVPVATAEVLYDWASVGTRVNVHD